MKNNKRILCNRSFSLEYLKKESFLNRSDSIFIYLEKQRLQ